MTTSRKTKKVAINTDSFNSINRLSTDNLRVMLNNRSYQKVAMYNSSLIKLLLPIVMVFVLSTAGTAILNADGRDEEGYIHKPKLVLWEEYYREWLDIEHQKMYGRPWDPNNPGDPLFFFNPDSVMVDVNWGECDGRFSPDNAVPPVPHLPRWFKNSATELFFDWNIIPRPEIYEDNRVIRYTIDDILPQYKETIEGFKQLEKIVGTFYFEDRNTIYPDTTVYIPGKQGRSPRILSIVFDNYVFDSEHGQRLDLQYSKFGLIDIEAALGNIKFVQEPAVFHRLGGHNPLFHTGIYDMKTNILPLSISPMITSDNITLSLPEVLTMFPKSIQIVDSTGKTVKLFYTGIDTQQVIDVSDLPAGRYFVQIDNYVGSFIVR